MHIASKNFGGASGTARAKRSRPEAADVAQEDGIEEDCEPDSEGEEAQERLEDSAPTKRAVDLQWQECTVPVCEREKAGYGPKQPGLKQRLDDSEEPILGLFLRFFPVAYFMAHIEKMRKAGKDKGKSRHHVPWDKGTFLRFLGVIIKLALYPLPNIEWHWRWPTAFPGGGPPSIKHIMREIVFKRYWRFACLPDAPDGLVDRDADHMEGRSETYVAAMELLSRCVVAWQNAWNPGTILCVDESMIFWTGTSEIHVAY